MGCCKGSLCCSFVSRTEVETGLGLQADCGKASSVGETADDVDAAPFGIRVGVNDKSGAG